MCRAVRRKPPLRDNKSGSAARISRVLSAAGACAPRSLRHLSMPPVARTATLATYPPASDEQPYCAGIHGLATRKRYGPARCRGGRWALTPPFHPYPEQFRAVVFCYPRYALADIYPLGSAVLCVARTFLSLPAETATEPRRRPAVTAVCGCKCNGFREIILCGSDEHIVGAGGTEQFAYGPAAFRSERERKTVHETFYMFAHYFLG